MRIFKHFWPVCLNINKFLKKIKNMCTGKWHEVLKTNSFVDMEVAKAEHSRL